MTDAAPSRRVLFGFHAVGARLKTAPASVVEVHVDAARRDARMRGFVERVRQAGARLVESDGDRLGRLAGTWRHQGVVARVEPLAAPQTLDAVLDAAEAAAGGDAAAADPPLVLLLDEVTDPHNLGACLRVADGAGAHAVVAPRDRAVGPGPTVAKVASGAAETVPYLMVTNLARTIELLRQRDVRVVGLAGEADTLLWDLDLRGPLALVLGAEGGGLRQRTRQSCDALAKLPMMGGVESLNVSVAAGVCLYEARRQRLAAAGSAPG